MMYKFGDYKIFAEKYQGDKIIMSSGTIGVIIGYMEERKNSYRKGILLEIEGIAGFVGDISCMIHTDYKQIFIYINGETSLKNYKHYCWFLPDTDLNYKILHILDKNSIQELINKLEL